MLNTHNKKAAAYYVEYAKQGWTMFNSEGHTMNIEDKDPSDDVNHEADDLDGVLFNTETKMGYGEDTVLKKFNINYNWFTRGQLAYRAAHNNEDWKPKHDA